MLGSPHDVALVHDDVLLLVFDDYFLIDHLHRVELAVPSQSTQVDFGKSARTDQLENLETVQGKRLSFVH